MQERPRNYLIVGDDRYLREREIGALKEKELSGDTESTDVSHFTVHDMEGIMAEAGTMPFLSGKRMVLVGQLEDIDEKSLGTLLRYLRKPFESTVLVMTAGADFRKKKAFREISGLVEVRTAQEPSKHALEKRIQAFFRNHGVDITSEAVRLIIQLKGNDTAEVKNAVDKLMAFSEGARIEASHVRRMVARTATEKIFKLVDAVDSGDVKWALSILDDLYAEKAKPESVIGYMAWYLRTMQKINGLMAEGRELAAISKELGYGTAYTRRLVSGSGKYTPSKIRRWGRYLREADTSTKTGRASSRVAVDMLLVRLASGV